MKRSEVIQIISNHLYELNVEPEDCDTESDKILKALEKAGMLPPKYTTYTPFSSTIHLKWEMEDLPNIVLKEENEIIII